MSLIFVEIVKFYVHTKCMLRNYMYLHREREREREGERGGERENIHVGREEKLRMLY